MKLDWPKAGQGRRGNRKTLPLGSNPWMTIAGLTAAGLWFAYFAMNRRYSPQYADLALTRGHLLTSTAATVVAVASEPSELERYVGGTLRILAEGGSEVVPVIVSDGENRVRRRNGAEIRRREAECSAAVLGLELPVFLDYDPQTVASTDAQASLTEALLDMLQQVKPEVVLAPAPPASANSVSASQAVGQAALEAFIDFGNPSMHLYGYGQPPGDVVVDITGYEKDKTRALSCHTTQALGRGVVSTVAVRLGGILTRGRVPARATESLVRLW